MTRSKSRKIRENLEKSDKNTKKRDVASLHNEIKIRGNYSKLRDETRNYETILKFTGCRFAPQRDEKIKLDMKINKTM